ncbi:PEPxxWA-CTERM sorting domain-containing protein [Porphyrobacter sp. GA68]|uniref:PEPxxWA-CTERM sorting domain-containing protein n=1 Tax=Porphyrobacter sp. GA68 TaxID=2883480 RepID=UPI001D1989D5|nr:PEPxxWA-CTERM sorting domain-containing protein [Porphyrobacter sp. GA68]
MRTGLIIATAAAGLLCATTANAAIVVLFDDFDDGFANFANTVTAAGGTQTNFTLVPGGTAGNADFTITRPSGGIVGVSSAYSLFGASPSRTTTGGVVDISPSGPNTNPRGNPLLYRNSGITFNFTNPINSLGFEVGDWATCCQPSNLWIQFGSNAPIQLGSSTTFGDQFLTNRGAGVFVAAFDDSDTFSTVSFWGDGVGEFLVAGGTIRYAALDRGSLPPTGAVPEPATWAMMLLGFFGIGLSLRSRKSRVTGLRVRYT